jgi:hypothetical protein
MDARARRGLGALFKAAVSDANGVARADASQNSGGLSGRGLWKLIRVIMVLAWT